MRLLRGEPLELVARELSVTAADLSGWHDAFIDGGSASLRSRPRDARDETIDRLDQVAGGDALYGTGIADSGTYDHASLTGVSDVLGRGSNDVLWGDVHIVDSFGTSPDRRAQSSHRGRRQQHAPRRRDGGIGRSFGMLIDGDGDLSVVSATMCRSGLLLAFLW